MSNRNALLVLTAVAAAIALAMKIDNPSTRYWSKGEEDLNLRFSHTLHVKENGIACEDCHTSVTSSRNSSDNLIGTHETCATCHEEQLADSCAYCHTSKNPVPPLVRQKRELMFSHERHTAALAVSCDRCHQGVEDALLATSENMPSMATCIDCHTEQRASLQCETCHTDFVSLLPDDHRTGDFGRRHKESTRLGMMDVSCGMCHTESFCQDCHTGTELQGFGLKRDLMTEPSPRSSTKDSPKQLRLQQVHDLNYRYTHGIDARSKRLDCASCHEQQSFCATCHEAGGNITQEKFKPASHSLPGFTTLGKGSGGGRHAVLARRDIESCASCHDVEGRDPTCLLCHSENGGVR